MLSASQYRRIKILKINIGKCQYCDKNVTLKNKIKNLPNLVVIPKIEFFNFPDITEL